MNDGEILRLVRLCSIADDVDKYLPVVTKEDFKGWFTKSHPEKLYPSVLSEVYYDILGYPKFNSQIPEYLFDHIKYPRLDIDGLEATYKKIIEKNTYQEFRDWFIGRYGSANEDGLNEVYNHIKDPRFYPKGNNSFKNITNDMLKIIQDIQKIRNWKYDNESRDNFFNSERNELKWPILCALFSFYLFAIKRNVPLNTNSRFEVEYIHSCYRREIFNNAIRTQHKEKMLKNMDTYGHKKSFLYEYGNMWYICSAMHPLLGWCAKIILDSVREIYKIKEDIITYEKVCVILTKHVLNDEPFKKCYDADSYKYGIAAFIGNAIALIFYGYTSIGLYSILGVTCSRGDIVTAFNRCFFIGPSETSGNTLFVKVKEGFKEDIENIARDDIDFNKTFKSVKRLTDAIAYAKNDEITKEKIDPADGIIWYTVNENLLVKEMCKDVINLYPDEPDSPSKRDKIDGNIGEATSIASKNYKAFMEALKSQVNADGIVDPKGYLSLSPENWPMKFYVKKIDESRYEMVLNGYNENNATLHKFINYLIYLDMTESPAYGVLGLMNYCLPDTNSLYHMIVNKDRDLIKDFTNANDVIELYSTNSSYAVYLTSISAHTSLMIYTNWNELIGHHRSIPNYYSYMYYENLLYNDGITISFIDKDTVENAFNAATTLFTDMSPDSTSIKNEWFPPKNKTLEKYYHEHNSGLRPIKGELEHIYKIYGGSYMDVIITLLKVILVVLIILIVVTFVSKAQVIQRYTLGTHFFH